MSTVKERVEEIMQRPMSRQQFLKQIGLVLLAAVGITNIINTLDPKRGTRTGGAAESVYGSSVYAGGKKPA